VDVPVNRDDLLRRVRQTDRRNRDGTGRNLRTIQRTGFISFLENLAGSLERTILVFSNIAILAYQLAKYGFITMLIIFGLVLGYYGFKYVLLFLIWLQNHL